MANKDIKDINRSTYNASDDQRLEAIDLVFAEMAKLDKDSITGLVVGVMTNKPGQVGKPMFVSFVGDTPVVANILQNVTLAYMQMAVKDFGLSDSEGSLED